MDPQPSSSPDRADLAEQGPTAWNATAQDYPLEGAVHQEFLAWAARQPGAVAVQSDDRVWTYRELEERSGRLARHLRSLGVGPEVVVGVHTDRSVDMVLGKVAVLRAGGAYMPLDPMYPEYRQSLMLEDSGARVVLTQASHRDDLPVSEATLVELDSEASWTGASSLGWDGDSGVAAQNTAYVVYTSGSTGRPKGVCVEHRALSNLVGWHRDRYSVSPKDRATQVATMGFDACVWELWPYLTCGARVDVMPEDVRRDPPQMWSWYRRQGTTLSFLPTPLAEAALRSLEPEGLLLRALLTGGDRLKSGVAEGQLPFTLVNHYGPTESAVVSTAGDVGEVSPPTIGGPIGNTQIHVLDHALNPVPVGMAGEIYVGGKSLARGYLGQPDQTAERFVPSPTGAGTRLYKTGDLGRWRSDGMIDFLGRNDDQVKIRGFRIEIGEIEHALVRHEEVREAVVFARDNDQGERMLVAYLALQGDQHVVPDSVREGLLAQLPDYMVPAAFVVLDALPLTANGKVDRKALPAPDLSSEARADSYVEPRNDAEATLVKIWEGLLRVGRIGVRDNFFELGGDSILSFQVAAAAREHGLHLTPQQMFQLHTVEEQAASAAQSSVVSAEQAELTGEVGLLPTAIWWLSLELPEAHHFNQSRVLELRQDVTEAVLQNAVAALMQHHDVLRSRFSQDGGEWRQEIEPAGGLVPFEWVDLGEVDGADRTAAFARVATELQHSLHLEAGPVFRVAWIRLHGTEPSLLMLIAHHLVVDGLSWRVLIEDLATACEQGLRGEAIDLPAKTSSVADWGQRLHQRLAGTDELRAEIPFWISQGNQATPLPRDHDVPDDANTEATAHTVWRSLSDDATQRLLQDAPRAFGTEINDVLVTGLLRAMERWTGRPGQVILMEGHGREPLFDDVDLSRTVGWFTSMYPAHLELAGDWRPVRCVTAVAKQLSRVPRGGVGYGVLKFLEEQSVSEQLHQVAAPEVSFNYMGQVDQALASSALFHWSEAPEGPTRSPLGPRDLLLEMAGEVREGQLRVGCCYSLAIHEQQTIASLLDGWVAALTDLATAAVGGTGLATAEAVSHGDLDQQDLDRLLEDLD